MKHYLIFIISFFSWFTSASAMNTISLLQGDRQVTYTTPIDGQILFSGPTSGIVLHDQQIYTLDDSILKINEDILWLKKMKIDAGILSAKENITITAKGKKNGFVTSQDMRNAQQTLTDLLISEKENEKNMLDIKIKKQYLSLKIPGYFIVRNKYTYDNAYLKEGDRIITVEYLDNLQLNVKIDPIMLQTIKVGSQVNWHSLITRQQGIGNVLNIIQDDDPTSGLKKIIIGIKYQDKTALLDLIDTPFEVSFND